MNFQKLFRAITKYDPFPWQEELFNHFVENKIPTYVDIPTGCGKTKIMTIWLLALAWQARSKNIQLPRRLVWIVNRRTVVDQATEEAEEIVHALEKNPDLRDLRGWLASASVLGEREPVTVSTLRGEYVDNEKWKEDPSRPAIIVGTVDMVGSKLLFRGYGDGKWKRSYHAGLLGVDTLVVLDEVHLIPAFERVMRKIEQINRRFPSLKPFQVMFVGATQRRKGDGALKITDADKKNPEIMRRLHARKILHLMKVSPRKTLCKAIVDLAKKYENSGSKVAIFVQSPENAREIADELKKETEEVLLLTGEIRGYDREKLTHGDLFKSFKFGAKRTTEKTMYFVATSAGEVGIDLDADHCICDLVPIDSLIQRLGRVNRGGRREESRIDLLFTEEELEKESPIQESKKKTLEFLKRLGEEIDVSPEAIAKWEVPSEAFSPEPFAPELTENELELWSMTSVSEKVLDPNARYRVEYWLHGREEAEPEVFLVWRKDVKYLAPLLPEKEEEVEEILVDFFYPLSKERLRVPVTRFVEFCRKLREKSSVELEEQPVVILRDDVATLRTVKEMIRMKEPELKEELAFSTIFLPCEIGGLNNDGYLDESWIGKPREELDVAEIVAEGKRKRLLSTFDGGAWRTYELESMREEAGDLAELLGKKYQGWTKRKLLIKEEPETYLIYLKKFEYESNESDREVPLVDHEKTTKAFAELLCEKLSIPPHLTDLVVTAAAHHDEGKRLRLWQEKMLHNENPSAENLLAKGSKGRGGEHLDYRHELGSLILTKEKISENVALHLIAASHGRARPTFEEKDFKHIEGEYVGAKVSGITVKEIREECAIRFYQLQAQLGYWNLAYIESLVKAADIMASREGEK